MTRRFDLLDLRLLKAFLVVSDLRSFAQAAAVLDLSPAGVTVQVNKLEALLEAEVFGRRPGSGRRAGELTEVGVRLQPYARALLLLNDRAWDGLSPTMCGEVRLAVSETVVSARLLEAIRIFRGERPDVELDFQVVRTGAPEGIFRRTGAEVLVYRAFNVAAPGSDAAPDISVWVARDARLFDARPLALVTGGVFHAEIASLLRQAGVMSIPCVVARGLYAQILAVRAGLGVTVLPLSLVPPDLVIAAEGILPQVRGSMVKVLLDPRAGGPLARELARAILAGLQYPPA